MSVTFDPSGDFASIMDGLEAVTLRVPEQPAQSIANAHRGQVGAEEAEASGGYLRQSDTVWQFPASEVTGAPPLGSVIEGAAGDRWTILAINLQVLSSKWEAACRNMAVEERLDDTVSLHRATYTRDANGEAIATWSVLLAAVKARIQPIASEANVAMDGDQASQEWRVVLEQSLDADVAAGTVDMRVIDSADNEYTVVRYEQSERIDVLPALICRKVD